MKSPTTSRRSSGPGGKPKKGVGSERKEAQAARGEHVAANTLPEDELADTFRDDVTGL